MEERDVIKSVYFVRNFGNLREVSKSELETRVYEITTRARCNAERIENIPVGDDGPVLAFDSLIRLGDGKVDVVYFSEIVGSLNKKGEDQAQRVVETHIKTAIDCYNKEREQKEKATLWKLYSATYKESDVPTNDKVFDMAFKKLDLPDEE